MKSSEWSYRTSRIFLQASQCPMAEYVLPRKKRYGDPRIPVSMHGRDCVRVDVAGMAVKSLARGGGEGKQWYRLWTLAPSCDASCDIVMTGSSPYFED